MSTSGVQLQIAELKHQNQLLQTRMKRLECLLATTDQPPSTAVGGDHHTPEISDPDPSGTQSTTGANWTRRALLFGGVGAAAGGLVNLTTGASPATAAAGDPILAGRGNDAGNSATSLSASASYALGIFNDRSAATALYAETRSGVGNGVRGVCRDGSGLAGESTSGSGVQGVSTSGFGVLGTSSSAAGVQGRSSNGPAVSALGGTNYGLSAQADSPAAISGYSPSNPGAILISGEGAALRLSPGVLDSVPQGGSWESGDFLVTRNDEIWLHSGGWRLLASPRSTGAYVPITPARVYDSRNQQPDAGAILVGGTQRVINVGVARHPTTGAPQSRVVPLGTRAVTANITITGTTRSGYVALTPGLAQTATSSAINWTAPQTTLANGLVLTTDTLVQLKAWVVGGDTHLIIDVMGYFGEA